MPTPASSYYFMYGYDEGDEVGMNACAWRGGGMGGGGVKISIGTTLALHFLRLTSGNSAGVASVFHLLFCCIAAEGREEGLSVVRPAGVLACYFFSLGAAFWGMGNEYTERSPPFPCFAAARHVW